MIRSSRLVSIDILRGLIMALMALDHSRYFWGANFFHPTDLTQTDSWWFMTRWITHFCAPLFMLLTGISAYLYYQKVQSKRQLSYFLLTRGLALILIELLIINLSWQFGYGFTFVQVLWALGCSMIVLSGVIYLSRRWIALLSVALIVLHNGFNDQYMSQLLGVFDWLWALLHQAGPIRIWDHRWTLLIAYPLLPWPGVMALGYVIGHWFTHRQPVQRQQLLLHWGLACILGFILLRYGGWYGDGISWPTAVDHDHPILLFLKTQKYPPSLQYLLMTLGPGLVVLAWLDKGSSQGTVHRILQWFKVFGAVPMFFYLLHVPLINGGAQLYSYLVYGKAVVFFYGPEVFPEGYQPSLLLAYIAWGVLLAVLYWPCKKYCEYKKRVNAPWLSYL